MCSAAERLSRRRTCQTSCARMASKWASSRRLEMPSGQMKVGRAIPKIPGSRGARDKSSRMGSQSPPIRSTRRRACTLRPSCKGIEDFIAEEIRNQRTVQTSITARTPLTHRTPANGRKCVRLEYAIEGLGVDETRIADCENGWPIWSMAKEHPGLTDCAECRIQVRRWPSSTNSEKGTRNFSDAANHSQ